MLIIQPYLPTGFGHIGLAYLPQFPYLSLLAVLGALVLSNFLLFAMGLKKF